MQQCNMTTTTIFVIAVFLGSLQQGAYAQGTQTIGTAAPLETDSAGHTGQAAVTSVFRVICKENGTFGTGFLHKSGNVITAAHVIDGCANPVIALPDNKTLVAAKVMRADYDKDLALLKPETPISGNPLPISNTPDLAYGAEIAFWGFPSGYVGVPPMLSVGYIAGIDGVRTKTNKIVPQLVVNAAINHGNSGGPVLLVETGEVIGVADNKIAPLSDVALSALNALQNQPSGFTFTATSPDGKTRTFSEAQVVAMVLEELRQQVQLVIGHAVMLGDLRTFLTDCGVDP
ncbi:MAG: serine protease [Rhizomicrobium sp.]